MNLNLNNQRGFNWVRYKNVITIGYAFLSDKTLLEDYDLAKYFSQYSSKKEVIESINNLNGFFSVIIKTEKGYFIAVDHVKSFPILWSYQNKKCTIYDRLPSKLEYKLSFNSKSVDEFLCTGYVTGNDTLFNEIKQLGAGEYLWIEDGQDPKVEEYYRYEYKDFIHMEKQELFKKIDEVYDNMTRRLIKFLDGRTAVIPLSGGHDSRLIAFFLKKHGYHNIVAYTYGKSNNAECIASKKVADYLNIKWQFIPYENQIMKSLYTNKNKYSKMADYCGNINTVPHIQEWLAMDYLTEKAIIPKNSVIVPGFSGDFLNGSHLQYKKSDNNELINDIINTHYRNYPFEKRKGGYKKRQTFEEKIRKSIRYSEVYKNLSSISAYEAFEYFDWKERQCKHINHSVRIYELYDYQWAMPLWDKEVINLWTRISIKERYGRKLFFEYTEWAYGDLMEIAPIYQPTTSKVKNKLPNNKLLLKFAYKLKWIYIAVLGRRIHPLNYYGYIPNRNYYESIIIWGSTSYYFMFSLRYLRYLNKKY